MANQRQMGIQELSFSNVIGDRFGRYSKYIIQDRALPDIRDGLKPVQRRILYAMFNDGNTATNPYRKSAKTVGNVIGNYHPHGDSSVYEAMVRMSQSWKNRMPLVDMHGNNGSMDGDPAAAMRYTEARLSNIAMELLRDINADTVDWMLNFDDTEEEPRVLPARFPNLLVNGAAGISAGYATDIPPHNLAEVIDAVIYILNNQDKKITLANLMKFIKGPDFPTGAIIQGKEGLKKAYRTGQGKVVVRSKVEVEKLKGGKSQIIVSEVPFDVNKGKLIQKLDDIRLSRRIDGIADVRDDSDINGVSLVIELKRDVDAEPILNYLYKNTDLQVNYNFNMVAIHNRRPELCSLEMMLTAYIDHQRNIIRRRTQHNLERDQTRLHIVDGLIRVLSILDEVIATIRASQNKADAKNNLVAEYDFSLDQAEAIVSLQLYRLTNTDIVALESEKLELNERIHLFETILADPATLDKVLVTELKEVKQKFKSPRLTQVEDEIDEILVEETLLIPQEQVYVSITKEGYMKRTSVRSFSASDATDLGSRDFDYPLFVQELSTRDDIIILTSKGNYIHLPVHELPDIRWKNMGIHWSQRYQLEQGEQVVAVFAKKAELTVTEDRSTEPEQEETLVFITKKGRVKQTLLSEFKTYRSYKSRSAQAMKLQADDDEVVQVYQAKPGRAYQVVLLTHRSYGLRFDLEEVSVQGLKAQGVIGINLKDEDVVVAGMLVDTAVIDCQLFVLTQRGNAKRFRVEEVAEAKRGGRGTLILKELKANPHRLTEGLALMKGNIPLVIQGDTGHRLEMKAFDITLTERVNNGSVLPELEKLGQIHHMHKARLKMLDDAE